MNSSIVEIRNICFSYNGHEVLQVVGLILVIALLTIPPFIVEKYVKSLFGMMAGSVLLGAVFTTSGLWVSSAYNITSGASIILVAGSVFLLIQLIERLIRLRFARLFSRSC
jgi:zinc transport system permease protein